MALDKKFHHKAEITRMGWHWGKDTEKDQSRHTSTCIWELGYGKGGRTCLSSKWLMG